MSIFFIPSSDFGGNRRPSSDYAHPAHGRLGVLGTSGSDPRERGRVKSKAEREQEMEAFHAKRRKQAEDRKEKEKRKIAELQQRKAAQSRADYLATPEGARMEAAREKTQAQAAANRARKIVRLTPEEQQARMEEIRASRAQPASQTQPERKVSVLDLLQKPLASASQTFELTTPNIPSSYLNQLDARAAARMPQAERMTQAEYVPAAQSQARYDAQRAAEVPATRAAVSQEIAARKPKAPVAASSAQDRNRALISQAFAVPASGPVPSMQFSPEMQRARKFQEERFAAGGNPAVMSFPNEFVAEMGDLLTNGFSYFNRGPLTAEQQAALNEARRTGRDFTSDIGDEIADAFQGIYDSRLGRGFRDVGRGFRDAGSELGNLPYSVNEALRRAMKVR